MICICSYSVGVNSLFSRVTKRVMSTVADTSHVNSGAFLFKNFLDISQLLNG